jgi:hypothetical protein
LRKLTVWQRLQLLLKGYTFLRWEKRPGWSGYLPIYLVKCRRHGLFEDYPHGYREYFICPKCLQEANEEWREKEK